ncbi:MAG: hypothetical protein PVF73_03995 [Bacteroidales bacterium]
MNKSAFFFILFHTVIVINLSGQENVHHDPVFPSGISVQYGFGRYSIRDEYISDNRYTGAFPEFSARWSNYHGNHGFELDFFYGQSSVIKDHNAAAGIQEYSVSGRHLYPLENFHLCGKPVYLFLGPSWNFYLHFRNQNMASSVFTKTMSLASLISGGADIKSIILLTPKIRMETSLGTNVFSLAARLPDLDIEEAKYLKLSAFPWTMDSYFDLRLRYRISRAFSIGTGYRFRLTRLHASSQTERTEGWYALTTANNTIFINLQWHIEKQK